MALRSQYHHPFESLGRQDPWLDPVIGTCEGEMWAKGSLTLWLPSMRWPKLQFILGQHLVPGKYTNWGHPGTTQKGPVTLQGENT